VGLGASARHCFIGGATAAEANVISNNDIGIELRQVGTDYNFVLGNRIGVGASGDQPMGNHEDGIWIADYAAHNWVQGNVIAYNAAHRPADRAGVRVMRGSGNTLRRNAIYSSAGLGILLADDGNHALSAPVIARVDRTGVAGAACPGCVVEVFSDAEDEGRVYEGTAVADAQGHFTFTAASGLAGPFISATATDGEGNTSEFSAPRLLVLGRSYLPLLLRQW
jgi:titin